MLLCTQDVAATHKSQVSRRVRFSQFPLLARYSRPKLEFQTLLNLQNPRDQ